MGALRNSRHEAFAIAVASGESALGAYVQTYRVERDNCGSASACRLMGRSDISERINELKTHNGNHAILSLAEKRRFLRSVVKTPIGDVDETSELAQSVKRSTRRTRDGETIEDTEIKLPDKLRAVELDAKLAGELDFGANGINITLTIDQRRVLLDGVDVIEVDERAELENG